MKARRKTASRYKITRLGRKQLIYAGMAVLLVAALFWWNKAILPRLNHEPRQNIPIPANTTNPQPLSNPAPAKTRPPEEKTKLHFSKPVGQQTGSVVTVNADLPERVDGKCTFTFEQAPAIVETYSDLRGASTCTTVVDRARLPWSGTWKVTIRFTSLDQAAEVVPTTLSMYLSE